MAKSVVTVLLANNLGASVDTIPMDFGEERSVRLTFTASITNGAGAAPTSTPVGTWTLFFSHDGVEYFQISTADVAAELAFIAAAGNTLVRKAAIIHDPPGRWIRASYTRGSGGGAGTSCTVTLEIAK